MEFPGSRDLLPDDIMWENSREFFRTIQAAQYRGHSSASENAVNFPRIIGFRLPMSWSWNGCPHGLAGAGAWRPPHTSLGVMGVGGYPRPCTALEPSFPSALSPSQVVKQQGTERTEAHGRERHRGGGELLISPTAAGCP